MAGGSFGVFSQGFGRIDQGVDFGGSGPIPALGPGVVTDVGRAHIIQGYDVNYLVYKLTGGPYKGQYVYVAENFTPQVKVGDKLKHGQSVGTAAGASPYIEVGFNQTSKGWTAYGSPSDRNGPAGTRMYKFIQSQIGHTKVTPPPKGSGNLYDHPPKGSTVVDQGFRKIINGVAYYPDGSSGPGFVGQGLHDVAAPFESVGSFLSQISTASFWLRALEVVGGGLMIVMGLYLLARQIGAPSVAGAIPGPIGTAAKSASAVGPSEPNPPATSTRRARIVHHYHPVGSPASDRHDRELARPRTDYDPATAEIPF